MKNIKTNEPQGHDGILVKKHLINVGIILLVLCILISTFFIGYSTGYRSAIMLSLKGLQKESLAQQVYANAFLLSNTRDSNILDNEPDLESDSNMYTACLITYNDQNQKKALQFLQKWKKKGISLIIKENFKGQDNLQKNCFAIYIEPENNKEKLTALIETIRKEENLPPITIELYSSEEKRI